MSSTGRSTHPGSASALTRHSDGYVVSGSLARYAPFGDWRTEPTTNPTISGRGYTGHRHNNTGANDLGLIYMGARFYVPSIGRFASADTIVPEPTNPQSFNRYSYTFNNPLRYTDPSGHCPWCFVIGGGIVVGGGVGLAANPEILPWNPPAFITERVSDPITSNNMTTWLRNQMIVNAQSQVAQNIRQNWHSYNPINKDAALQAWTALVGTDAIWDFKVDILAAGKFVDGTYDVILGNRQLNFDAVANIHYGFVGRAAGFGGDFLVQAAGLAQWQRWQQTGNPDDQGACNLTYYCDHPFATWSVRFGIYLYDVYGDKLDQLDDDALAQALQEYIETYGEPPDPPSGAISP